MRDFEVQMKASSRELTFEICTSHDARALHEINALLLKYGIRASDSTATNLNLVLTPSDYTLYERLKKTRETEEKANQAYSNQMKGRAVTYGDIIQLRHTKRQAFLGVDVSMAPRVDSAAKRIFLTTELDGLVRFRILPRFHYLVEGHTVCFGDSIALCSADFPEQYLHTSLGFRSEDIGIVYEVNLSRDASTVWGLEWFFCYDSFSESSVKTGDVVRLYHPSSGGFVAAGHEGGADRVVLERSEVGKGARPDTLRACSLLRPAHLRSTHVFTGRKCPALKNRVRVLDTPPAPSTHACTRRTPPPSLFCTGGFLRARRRRARSRRAAGRVHLDDDVGRGGRGRRRRRLPSPCRGPHPL